MLLDNLPFTKITTLPLEDMGHKNKGVQVHILRLDLTHEIISGNKWFKLMYNIKQALEDDHHTLLTFGGAYSNHISAVAEACKQAGLNSIGVIRGEPTEPLNPTLMQALECGMELHYIPRSEYRERKNESFIEGLHHRFGDFYHVPEGGSNALGVTGAKEIASLIDRDYDYICCACGTGGTLAGIISAGPPCREIIGFPVL